MTVRFRGQSAPQRHAESFLVTQRGCVTYVKEKALGVSTVVGKGVIRGIQMTRNVRKGQVLGANQLHWWTSEHAIVLLTYKSCIFDCLGRNIVHVGTRTNNPDIVFVRLEGVECNVCPPYQCNPLLQQKY